MNKTDELNSGVFQFIQDKFISGKKDKEYILKISSNDTLTKYPFDFQIKFAMDIKDSSNNFKKEAIIYNKYTDITSIEIKDVIIPRYIPTSTLGKNIDGFRLIKTAADKFKWLADILCNNGNIYVKGIWAKIISTPKKKFKTYI